MAADTKYVGPGLQRRQDGTTALPTGGVLDIESGAAFKIAGTSVTTALATAPAAVAAGYKIARGVTALDGSNPTAITTGLTTVTGFGCCLEGSAAPGVGTSVITHTISGGTVSLYAWKVTSNADPTLIASTGTENVAWVAVGT